MRQEKQAEATVNPVAHRILSKEEEVVCADDGTVRRLYLGWSAEQLRAEQ